MKAKMDRGDASISRGTPKVVGSLLKEGDRHGTDSPFQPSEAANPTGTVISDFSLQNSETTHFSWVSPSVSDTVLQQSQ